jgi:hypothetical protein
MFKEMQQVTKWMKLSPKLINKGFCSVWADLVNEELPNSKLCSSRYRGNFTDHAFIYIEGKFYDSECLEGVKDWRFLPCLKGGSYDFHKDMKFMKRKEFLRLWKLE